MGVQSFADGDGDDVKFDPDTLSISPESKDKVREILEDALEGDNPMFLVTQNDARDGGHTVMLGVESIDSIKHMTNNLVRGTAGALYDSVKDIDTRHIMPLFGNTWFTAMFQGIDTILHRIEENKDAEGDSKMHQEAFLSTMIIILLKSMAHLIKEHDLDAEAMHNALSALLQMTKDGINNEEDGVIDI